MVRHVYLTDRHSPDVEPSWFGESIGHYENGDTSSPIPSAAHAHSRPPSPDAAHQAASRDRAVSYCRERRGPRRGRLCRGPGRLHNRRGPRSSTTGAKLAPCSPKRFAQRTTAIPSITASCRSRRPTSRISERRSRALLLTRSHVRTACKGTAAPLRSQGRHGNVR